MEENKDNIRLACNKCNLQYKWSPSSTVFSSDLAFDRIEICNECIKELQDLLWEWKK